MKKNKAERGDMECSHMEGEGEIVNSLGRKGFTEKVVSGHRPENREWPREWKQHSLSAA